MRFAVRSLARYHACIRAQIDLMPAAEAYVEQWKDAMERRGLLPDYEDYFRNAAYAVRVPILDDGPYAAYLEGCANDWRLPDPARIVQAIVHAHAEKHLLFNKRCGCPARQMLLSPVQEEGREDDWGGNGKGYEDEWEEEDQEEDQEEDDGEYEDCEEEQEEDVRLDE